MIKSKSTTKLRNDKIDRVTQTVADAIYFTFH